MTSDELVPRRVRYDDLRLQPLRIPSGWRVVFTNLYEVRPTDLILIEGSPPMDKWDLFEEDMIYLHHEVFDIGIDLGWYPACDPGGHFFLQVIRGQDWSHPIEASETTDFDAVIDQLEKWLAAGSRGAFGNRPTSPPRRKKATAPAEKESDAVVREEARVLERIRSPHPKVARDALRTVARWKSLSRRGRRDAVSAEIERALVPELQRMAADGPPWPAELIAAIAERPCPELEDHFLHFLEADPEHLIHLVPAWAALPRAKIAGQRAARVLRESPDAQIAYRAALRGARLGDEDKRTYEIIANAVEKGGSMGLWLELGAVLEPEERSRLNRVLLSRGMPPVEAPQLRPSHARARTTGA